MYPINTRENWGSGPFHPHTLGEGGRPWLESVINSRIASCTVSRSLLSQSGIRTMGRTNENYKHRKLTKMITRITALCNLVKLWAMLCRATQDRWVMLESFDETWSREKGMANHLIVLALRTPWTVWKGKKYDTFILEGHYLISQRFKSLLSSCQVNVCSSVLSHYNQDLEWQTLKPSVCRSSRVLDRPCYSS